MKRFNDFIIGSAAILALVLSVAFLGGGCKTLAPGADPLVVRTEQLETVAASAFDTVVILDNSNRSFWQTNAPAFHQFCEWLRTPIMIESTNSMRRGLAMVKLVDNAKLIYITNSSQSNILIQAVSDLQIAVSQAQSWSTIIQTPTH